MRRAIVALAVVGFGAWLASGSLAAATAERGKSGSGLKVALLMHGSRNDHATDQQSYTGLLDAEKAFGVKGTAVDELSTPDAQQRAVTAAAASNDLVIGDDETWTTVFEAAAKQYPKVKFALINTVLPKAPNLYWAQPSWGAYGYLAGAVAAKWSKTGVVGFVGGMLVPSIAVGRDGFTKGAKSVKPGIKVVSTIPGSFTDAAKTQQAVAAQIAGGADAIWLETDRAFLGGVQAAKQSGKRVGVMGAVGSWCSAARGTDIGDTFVNQRGIVKDIISGFVHNNLKSKLYGLENPKIARFQFCPGKATRALKAEVALTVKKLNSGQIKVPVPGTN